MNIEKIIESIEQNDALKEKLENMWRNEASSQEIADALAQYDLKIDASQAEDLLSALQNRQAEEFSMEKLDIDQLENVAGGTNAELRGKCTEVIFTRDCAATVEHNSWCGTNDACVIFANRYKYEKNPPSKNDIDPIVY